jgi:hypothetical protein
VLTVNSASVPVHLCATASTTATTTNPANDTRCVDVPIGAAVPDVRGDVSGYPASAAVGNTLSFYAWTVNEGPGSVPNLTLSVPVPAGTTLTSVTPLVGGSTCSGATAGATSGTAQCTWSSAVPSAQGNPVTVVLTVNSASVPVHLCATASTTAATTNPANDTRCVDVPNNVVSNRVR